MNVFTTWGTKKENLDLVLSSWIWWKRMTVWDGDICMTSCWHWVSLQAGVIWWWNVCNWWLSQWEWMVPFHHHLGRQEESAMVTLFPHICSCFALKAWRACSRWGALSTSHAEFGSVYIPHGFHISFLLMIAWFLPKRLNGVRRGLRSVCIT